MKNKALLAAIALMMACQNPAGPAPRKMDNACSILRQHRSWRGDLQRAERKWGVPVSVQMAIIWKESSFRPYARPRKEPRGSSSLGEPRSSAYGFAQAIDGTWAAYKRDTGQSYRRRTDFGDSTDFIGWYANESLRRSGIRLNDPYNQYLAYHQGHGGYNRGSYRNKSWLKQVARQVANREVEYRRQLANC